MSDSPIFSRHAVVQMFARQISPADVIEVLSHGRKVESYPDDRPYPSHLISGIVNGRFLHVVAAVFATETIFVTAFDPDPLLWNDDRSIRRK